MPKPLVIDLSHHNEINDFSALTAAGIVGVIHKATEGTTYTDRSCLARKVLTQDAGMCWGIYHFLKPGKIIEQAEYFLSKTNLYDENTLLCLDFEVDGISLSEVLSWLRYVEGKTGQVPVLYTGHTLKGISTANKFPELTKYRLWLAQYGPKPVLPKPYSKLWLWQYSQTGKVAGIEGNVDLDAYDGTAEQLRADWVIRTSASAGPAVNPPSGDSAEQQVVNTEVPTADSQQTPTTSTESTTKQIAITPEGTVATEQKVTQEVPKGDDPSVPPVQVTKNGLSSQILAGIGGVGGLATAAWGFLTSNPSTVSVGIICITVLILVIIDRWKKTDVVRMETAADPDKKNVS